VSSPVIYHWTDGNAGNTAGAAGNAVGGNTGNAAGAAGNAAGAAGNAVGGRNGVLGVAPFDGTIRWRCTNVVSAIQFCFGLYD
jgi:hypothetical protein